MTKKKILVTGGAGYIGSHMVAILLDAGHHVITLDDLSTGHRDAVPGGDFVQGNVGDMAVLDRIFSGHGAIDGVCHFAGSIDVRESVAKPEKYFQYNVTATRTLLDRLMAKGPAPFIFSSTCAIYGKPQRLPMDESHPIAPESPYAQSKSMAEEILTEYGREQGLAFIALRYFNAAGADPEGRVGERRDDPTHLIPSIFSVATGIHPELKIFGNDFDTPDGTAIRDYIHVADLCQAHLLALQWLWDGKENAVFNLGTGTGKSVLEVIDAARAVTGKDIPATCAPRRPGDLAVLVANNQRALRELSWKPQYEDLQTMIDHAWKWETRSRRT